MVRAVLAVKPPLLQLRDKSGAPRETLRVLREICALSRESSTRVIANDRPDLALMAGCQGVHLGQEDLPVVEARRFAPELLIGVSTHSLEQLETALRDAPDYVAFGPIYPTSTKADAERCVTLSDVRVAARECALRGIPLVAIGGIRLETLAPLRGLIDMAAVITGLLEGPPDDITRRAERLHQALIA